MATIIDIFDYVAVLKNEIIKRDQVIDELKKEINKTTK
tara:strand:- start:569 stop:682 length:114 start_codon:yes stop_codon:yes gene_type:complete